MTLPINPCVPARSGRPALRTISIHCCVERHPEQHTDALNASEALSLKVSAAGPPDALSYDTGRAISS